MAERVSGAIGDALLTATEWTWPRIQARLDAALEVVADAVRPHPPMTLTTSDGQVITGLVVLDRGRALLFIGLREPGPSAPPSPPQQPRVYDDVPSWVREELTTYPRR